MMAMSYGYVYVAQINLAMTRTRPSKPSRKPKPIRDRR